MRVGVRKRERERDTREAAKAERMSNANISEFSFNTTRSCNGENV